MIALILFVIFGLAMALFATQNISTASITVASYTFKNIPIYIVVIGAVFLGIFISWLISIADALSSSFTVHQKDSALNQANRTIESLQEEKHALEIENAHLVGEHHNPIHQEEEASADQPSWHPTRFSFFNRFKHNFG